MNTARQSCHQSSAGIPACCIADILLGRRAKGKSPSNARRLENLRYSRQKCLRYRTHQLSFPPNSEERNRGEFQTGTLFLVRVHCVHLWLNVVELNCSGI